MVDKVMPNAAISNETLYDFLHNIVVIAERSLKLLRSN